MDYIAMIQNRKSVRAFRTKKVPASVQGEIKAYYENCPKLLPEVKTELLVLDESAQKTLEGTAGYENFMIGAPNYLVLLSEENDAAEINGGYIMEDLILKLTEMDMNTCWITFAANGIAPGTKWEDVPADWVCPDCGLGKDAFDAK